MTQKRHIALLIESSRAYGRGLLRGIARYIQLHDNWSIYHYERRLNDPAPTWLKKWKGDGIIARLEPSLISQIQDFNLPTIDLTGVHHIDGIVMVDTNNRQVGKLAAEHLLDRGFDYFAFCGYNGLDYSDNRLKAFKEYVNEAGCEVEVYHPPRENTDEKDIVIREAPMSVNAAHMAGWLHSLPKPVGLLACNDVCGEHVLNVCREYNIQVPEQIAVIGVDNDEVLCQLAYPPMTSVQVNTERIGYIAAELLDQMIDGKKPEHQRIEIDPIDVVSRKSTDLLAIDDLVVAEAMQLMRENISAGVTVDSLVAWMNTSRSTLERRFAKALGRTPKAEILRLQIEHIKRLLIQTDLPLQRVAELSGFKYSEHMNMVFKKQSGKTPGEYRNNASPPTK